MAEARSARAEIKTTGRTFMMSLPGEVAWKEMVYCIDWNEVGVDCEDGAYKAIARWDLERKQKLS